MFTFNETAYINKILDEYDDAIKTHLARIFIQKNLIKYVFDPENGLKHYKKLITTWKSYSEYEIKIHFSNASASERELTPQGVEEALSETAKFLSDAIALLSSGETLSSSKCSWDLPEQPIVDELPVASGEKKFVIGLKTIDEDQKRFRDIYDEIRLFEEVVKTINGLCQQLTSKGWDLEKLGKAKKSVEADIDKIQRRNPNVSQVKHVVLSTKK